MTQMMNRRGGRTVVAGAALAVLLFAGAACSSGGSQETIGPPTQAPNSPQPSTDAKLTIVSPTKGEVLPRGDVKLKVKLVGGTLAPSDTTELHPDEGHLHLSVNGKLVAMTSGLTTQIEAADLVSGTNTIQVEFVANNHLPFAPPRVTADVVFEVEG